MIVPCPISAIIVFCVVTLKNCPFRLYGPSFAQISSTMLMDSRKIALRSFLKLPNTSASDIRPPGLMPKMKRPLSRWSSIATCAAIAAGCEFGMFTVPVPSTICFVSAARLAGDAAHGGGEGHEEHAGRGDVRGGVGGCPAGQRLAVAELVREQDRLAVLDVGFPGL